MFKLLVFAGTTEGRMLLSHLAEAKHKDGLETIACVATDYGKELLEEIPSSLKVLAGRLSEEEIASLIQEGGIDLVIDCTHPYAKIVTENIQSACNTTDCPYLRIKRDSSEELQEILSEGSQAGCGKGEILFFEDHEDVVSFLNGHPGKVLMTIGSKDLSEYVGLEGYQERLFIRVLPAPEVLESCFDLGFRGKQIMAMQGPFSYEMNLDLLRQIGAKYLLTKDTGNVGGLGEKIRAAHDVGISVLVLGRKGEDGLSVEEALLYLEKTHDLAFVRPQEFDLASKKNVPEHDGICSEDVGEKVGEGAGGCADLGRWFPLFTDLSNKRIVIIGAGKIASRRILTLSRFQCTIEVISKEALPEILELASTGRIGLTLRAFDLKDLEGADIVLAATNHLEINEMIHDACKARGVLVNVASKKEMSDFYFPGIVRTQGLTIGVTAEGKNHKLAKEARRAIEGLEFHVGDQSGNKEN